MNQFRAQRNSAGNLYIDELVRTPHGWAWREVCLRQVNRQTLRYE